MPGADGKDDEARGACGFGLSAFGFLFSRLPLCSRFATLSLLLRGLFSTFTLMSHRFSVMNLVHELP
jgi:hypothetical protein